MSESPYHTELTRGDVLDDAYRVVRLIAQGGMGHVYEAEQLRLDRRVALKILSVDPKKSGEFLPRFRREAEICAKLSHPNIIAVLDWNVAHGMPYLVMEYLEGEDLGMRIGRSTLELDEALYVLEGIAAGLGAAHAYGVVHRDLKPSNVFLCNVGMTRPHVKLLDFGVSKVAWETTLSTTSPKVLGSPRYMAPEQARGEANIDARVDQFALGTVAYEMFAGSFAFDGDSLSSVLYRVVHESPPALEARAPNLPKHVVHSIERAMEKDPARRFSDVAQFMAALRGDVPPHVAHHVELRTAQFQALTPESADTSPAQRAAVAPASVPVAQRPAELTAVKHILPTRTIVAFAAIAIALAIVVWRIGPRLMEPHATPPPVASEPIAPPPPTAQTDPTSAKPDDASARVLDKHPPERRVLTKNRKNERATTPSEKLEQTSRTPSVTSTGAAPMAPVGGHESEQTKRLIGEAQKLYDAGDYRETVARARQALGYEDSPRAHVLIVLAHCRLGGIGDAHAEMFSVRAQDRPAVVATCAKHGVDVSD